MALIKMSVNHTLWFTYQTVSPLPWYLVNELMEQSHPNLIGNSHWKNHTLRYRLFGSLSSDQGKI